MARFLSAALFAALVMSATPAAANGDPVVGCKALMPYLTRVAGYIDAVLDGDMIYQKAYVLSQREAQSISANPANGAVHLEGLDFLDYMMERAQNGLDYHEQFRAKTYADCVNPPQH